MSISEATENARRAFDDFRDFKKQSQTDLNKRIEELKRERLETIEDKEAIFLTALTDLLQAGGSLADISRVIRSTNWAQVRMLADKAGYTGEKVQVNAQESNLKSVKIDNDFVVVESESFGTFKLFLNDVQNGVVSLVDGDSVVFGEHDFGIISHDTDLWVFVSDYVLPEVMA